MAEYAGAASNPEIVTPQNILQDTFIESLFPLASAFHQDIMYLADVVRDNGVEIKGDAAEFLHVMKQADERNRIMSGRSLFSVF